MKFYTVVIADDIIFVVLHENVEKAFQGDFCELTLLCQKVIRSQA